MCILKPYGEILSSLFEILHTEKELSELVTMLKRFDEEVRVVMEATGAYHLPILSYLKEKDLYVSVINPFIMKEYRCKGLRRGKTDSLDAKLIANYGIDNWYHLVNYEFTEGTYQELKLLGRQYSHYMKMRIESVLVQTNILDYTMYAKGLTTRQISEQIEDIYGFEVSEGMVSDITNKLLPEIEEWQKRPLKQ